MCATGTLYLVDTNLLEEFLEKKKLVLSNFNSNGEEAHGSAKRTRALPIIVAAVAAALPSVTNNSAPF